jgi:hypothetical protein
MRFSEFPNPHRPNTIALARQFGHQQVGLNLAIDSVFREQRSHDLMKRRIRRNYPNYRHAFSPFTRRTVRRKSHALGGPTESQLDRQKGYREDDKVQGYCHIAVAFRGLRDLGFHLPC